MRNAAPGQPELTPLDTLSLYPRHDGTLSGLLASRAARAPDRPFLLFEGRTISWGGFAAAVDRAAAALGAKGLAKGDRVAVMAPNSDAYVLLLFALARLGAILVPLNPEFGTAEAGYVLAHAGVAAVACAPAALPVAREAAAALAPAPWFMTLDGSAAGLPRFEELSAPTAALPPAGGADEVCLIIYTSGTTGFPKGVMHSQRNLVLAGEGFVERMHLQPDDRLLCILPLFHVNALFYSLGGTLAAGATLVLAPRFSASGFWRLAAESGATEVNIIAAVGSILARRPRTEFVPGHSLRKVYGAPVPAEVEAVFRGDFGVPQVIEGYGMTEIPGACNQPFLGPHQPGSMGRAARHPDPRLSFAELAVVDEAGAAVADGAVGELMVRTPIVMKGYYRDPEQTAAAFRDGWFATGDLVRRDADGFFFFVARKKDIIRKKGENISGAELDRIVAAHPGVLLCAAVAVPSELGEDEILIAAVPRPGCALRPADIAAWCARHLAPIKRPRYVAIVEALPLTPTHRVAKFKLKQDPSLVARAVDLQASDSQGGDHA